MGDDEATARLFQAVDKGSVAGAREALDAGANVNSKNNRQQTLLHLAAICGYGGVARLLITKGSDINAQDIVERTPLDLAVRYGHPDIVTLLRDAAAGQHNTDSHTVRITTQGGEPQLGG